MKNLLKTSILTLTLAVFVLSPFAASADSNGKNKAEKEREKIEKRWEKEEKKAEKNEKKIKKDQSNNQNKCLRAWGHLVAFGWIKKNGSVNVDLDNCNFPFGIGKKPGSRATTTDIVAPVISNITSYTGTNKALIVWNTDEKTTGKVYYSTSSPVSLSNSPVIDGVNGALGKSHFAGINGLASSTTYYFIIEAKDKAGNVSRGNQSSFTTKTGSTTPDLVAPIISSINTTVSTSSINVNWQTNEAATSKVYYATSTPINTSTANFVLSGSLVTNHNLKIENLSTSTLFYLMIESVDSATNTATSSSFTATTTAL